MSKKKGVGRGLEAYEVALIKNMRHRKMTRDFIMSLILRPGRSISPAAVSEVMKGKIGPEIDRATNEETEAFIQMRMTGTSTLGAASIAGPTSQTVVLEIIRAAKTAKANYTALESRTLEFKQQVPTDKPSRCAIARTIAAYANTGGGYIVFGVRDDRQVVGLSDPEEFSVSCDQISDVVTECFSPAVTWEKNLVEYEKKPLGVIYTHRASTRPVIAMRDSADIQKSAIYFRYEGKTQRIEPGDLIQMLHERDQLTAAAAVNVDHPFQA